jgi:hypothetical protein
VKNKKEAYLASVQANEASLELYKQIDQHPVGKDEANMRASLIKVASIFMVDLEKHGALSPERRTMLQNAQIEAASSIKLAWGYLNNAIVDVMEKEMV